MTREEQEQLIEQVLRQVLGAVEPAQSAPAEQLLVLGPAVLVPADVLGRYRILEADRYTGPDCLDGVAGVYVTKLSRRDLADIALGRDSSTTACAVTSALLRGVPVTVLERALEHRAFAHCASPVFYQQLEGYVRRLQEFGVRIAGASVPVQKPKAAGCAAAPKLITEAAAQELVRTTAGPSISVPAGTILTPSARDVFRQAGRAVVRAVS